MTQQAKQYRATSKWCGWTGGCGSEGDIARHIEKSSAEGWEMVRTESALCRWYWFIPRYKVLFIFARS